MSALPTWFTYTEAELTPGAARYGLTLAQERQRLCLSQSNFHSWPAELKAYLRRQRFSGLEFDMFTLTQKAIVAWLKLGNSVDLSGPQPLPDSASQGKSPITGMVSA